MMVHMLTGTCAFCGNQTHFTARTGRTWSAAPYGTNIDLKVEVSATCDACHRFNTAFGTSTRTRDSASVVGEIFDAHRAILEGEAMQVESWSPPPMIPVDVSFIPEGVAGYFKEAHDAFSVGAHRAVLLLVRSVIEATAKDRGVDTGTLVQKINKLGEQGDIRRGTKDMAHALRILGNDMAHGDIDEVPNHDDANDALTIARFVLDDVYVADARRIDILERRRPPATE